MADHGLCWLIRHPATDRHPGAVMALTDPDLTADDTTIQLDMPCWVANCGCDDAYPARVVSRAVASAALNRSPAPPEAARAANRGRPGPTPRNSANGPQNGTQAPQRDRIDDPRQINDPAHPGDTPLPLFGDAS
jgi:hypothetical protein